MIGTNDNTVSLEVVDDTENMLGLSWFVSSSALGSMGKQKTLDLEKDHWRIRKDEFCAIPYDNSMAWSTQTLGFDGFSSHMLLTCILLFYLFIWPCSMACEILVPWPGTEPKSPVLKARVNHWIPRKSLQSCILEALWFNKVIWLSGQCHPGFSMWMYRCCYTWLIHCTQQPQCIYRITCLKNNNNRKKVASRKNVYWP